MVARRDFLKGAMASLVIPPFAYALQGRSTAYAARDQPAWRIGFDNPPAAELTAEPKIDGRLPDGLAGTFYRIGPALHERAGTRYSHSFDGDGMAQAWRIEDGRIHHQARMVMTPKYVAEERAGRFLFPGFGTFREGMQAVDSAGAVNTANINLISHGGRLLALWEGGEPFELAHEDLLTRGPVTFSPQTKGAPFSAHPRIEPDGTLWNFGAAQWTSRMVLYRLAPSGELLKVGLIAMPQPAMVHDFVVTARHLVVIFPSLVMDGTSGSFLDRHRFKPDLPMTVLVIDKNDFQIVRRYELPPGFVFHYGNGWEEPDGTIRLDACLYEDAGIMFRTLRHVMEGKVVVAPGSESALVTLRPDGRTEIQRLSDQVEFPRVDPRVVGSRYRMLYSATGQFGGQDALHPMFSGVQSRDLETDTVDRYDFPPAQMVEEHVFVPRPGGQGEADGWLIGTALDFDRRHTQLQVFDAARLADGPIAVARLPYVLPLGLHGSFFPA